MGRLLSKESQISIGNEIGITCTQYEDKKRIFKGKQEPFVPWKVMASLHGTFMSVSSLDL